MVPAVERAVRLLDSLARARRPLSLAQLARDLAAPKSSVHGLLSTLVELDLVRRSDAGEFSLGTRPLQWAGAWSVHSDVASAFHELAGDAGPLASETVMLAVLDGTDVLYLGCRPGTRALAVNFRVGGRFPASCTSSGKAILSTLDPREVRALFTGGRSLPRPTRHSVPSVAALLRQLTQARADGHATDDEEMAEGMECFGAPVFSAAHGPAVAAVAVSLIKAGTSEARRNELLAAIRGLAAQLSARLGAAQPAQAPSRPPASTLQGAALRPPDATIKSPPTGHATRRALPTGPRPGPSTARPTPRRNPSR
jgi:DNA-binding IclR family transcriptional regulator